MGICCRATSLVNGACRVFVHGEGVLNFFMVHRIEGNARRISVRDTKIVRNR
jgi:hypothetical protein